jgi:hypothetical protein
MIATNCQDTNMSCRVFVKMACNVEKLSAVQGFGMPSPDFIITAK